MGKVYENLDDAVQTWIAKQRMFFVGTAPSGADGLINVSPKGHDTLRILDKRTLAYADYGGSGVETIAHVRQNGRIVVMMCAFEGAPKTFRFYGKGEVITPLDDAFDELAAQFSMNGLGIRAVIRIGLTRIADSCGYGVPYFDYCGERPSSQNWMEKNGIDAVRDYQAVNSLQSLDGIPALTEEEARAYAAPTPDPQ